MAVGGESKVVVAPMEVGAVALAQWETTFPAGKGKVRYHPQAVVEGIVSASLSPKLELDKNTVVRRYDLKVKARRATQTAADKVAQVRAYSTTAGNTLVIDFG